MKVHATSSPLTKGLSPEEEHHKKALDRYHDTDKDNDSEDF